MYEETVSRYGQLDILVNNAGILLQGLLIEQAYEDIQEMLRVDLFGCFVAIKEALSLIHISAVAKAPESSRRLYAL